MFGLNLDEAVGWQKKLLEHIFVYDKERVGTMLLYNMEGEPATEIAPRFDDDRNVIKPAQLFLPVPISHLHPDEVEELKENLIQGHIFNKLYLSEDELTQSLIKYREDARLFADRVIAHARETIAKGRPPEHQYTPTDEENLQRLRVFVEMNKYPEASVRTPDTCILTAFADREDASYLNYPKEPNHTTYGFHLGTTSYRKQPLIGITTPDENRVRFTVAEEVFHSIDNNQLIRPQFSKEDCEGLAEKADKILHIYEQDKSGASQAFMQDFRKRMDHHAVVDRISLPDEVTDKILQAEAEIIRWVAEFHKNGNYKDAVRTWDREFFAKLAIFLTLRRHIHKLNDSKLERNIEAQLYDTRAGKAVIKVLDQIKREYEQGYSAEERAQAEHFADQAALELDKRMPNISYYMPSKPQTPKSFADRISAGLKSQISDGAEPIPFETLATIPGR